ncbi:PhnD/SsuA/transferrin family substrate-binding protein [Diaphorobacter caeni]|uniref:PhnD/SsuA/transferrin family substrate-binding protein n=1 Tax=Diaphorobacter caeni TaxID=2784387 RepID=UPI00188EEE7C|nr:PhnD/SsuA/transferrin family substrate-binding protein [Diaphorobacter caeni]MBF5007743.1 ABC transporter substrate-binding protein [Diaphorobacter caeni]
MARLPITIATWDYDRVRPLMDGRVEVEGCDVNFLAMTVEECFHRAYFHGEFDVAEIGLSPFLIALSRGIAPYVAVPAFVSRTFRHSAVYVRSDRGIDSPADLRGKRIGVPEYQQSAALWVRGFLKDDFGIEAHDIHWVQGGLEQHGRKDKFPLNLPEGFPLTSASSSSLSELLANGGLDAVISARAPSCLGKPGVPVKRLFEDYRAAEKEYFSRTGLFPLMHAVGVRKDMAEKHPWLAASVYKAFAQAKRIADQELMEVTALKIGLPWVTAELESTQKVMGEDFWPYGVAQNRKVLEAMTRYSFEQGLAVRKLSVDEIFAASTLDDVHV